MTLQEIMTARMQGGPGCCEENRAGNMCACVREADAEAEWRPSFVSKPIGFVDPIRPVQHGFTPCCSKNALNMHCTCPPPVQFTRSEKNPEVTCTAPLLQDAGEDAQKPTSGNSPLHDSGKREGFDTGAVRDIRAGKGRFDLISPIALLRLAQHYENGAAKYADRNWEKGMPVCRFLDSAMRHLSSFIEGRRDEDNLAAVAWNIFGAIHTLEMIDRGLLPKQLADFPNYVEASE